MRVLTLTANLLAETTYTLDDWREGATQRARRETFQAGGKGINVTRMLIRLGVESVALCFPGGSTGARCTRFLRERGIPFRAFPTPADTRTGAVVRAPGRAETTFLGAENEIAPDPILDCAAFLDAQPDGEILSLSGSVPAWLDPRWDPLRAALRRWCRRGILVADTYGPPLGWIAGLPAELVKINRHELASLAPAATGRPDVVLDRSPPRPRRWVITDGPNPVRFRDLDGTIGELTPPAVTEVSPTGSGDVLLALVIQGLFLQHLKLADAVERALPYAAANAASAEVAAFELPLPDANSDQPPG